MQLAILLLRDEVPRNQRSDDIRSLCTAFDVLLGQIICGADWRRGSATVSCRFGTCKCRSSIGVRVGSITMSGRRSTSRISPMPSKLSAGPLR